jgi:hypothetical protein
MTEVIECLPSKHQALISNLSTTKIIIILLLIIKMEKIKGAIWQTKASYSFGKFTD